MMIAWGRDGCLGGAGMELQDSDGDRLRPAGQGSDDDRLGLQGW